MGGQVQCCRDDKDDAVEHESVPAHQICQLNTIDQRLKKKTESAFLGSLATRRFCEAKNILLSPEGKSIDPSCRGLFPIQFAETVKDARGHDDARAPLER